MQICSKLTNVILFYAFLDSDFSRLDLELFAIEAEEAEKSVLLKTLL